MTAQPTASTGDVQARARELLAKQYDLTGAPSAARAVSEGALSPIERGDIIPAIIAALNEPFGNSEQLVAAGVPWQSQMADALDAFWNPACEAVQAASYHGPASGSDVVGAIAQGLAAVAHALRAIAPAAAPATAPQPAAEREVGRG